MKIDISTRNKAIEFLRMFHLTPYWDSEDRRPLFRGGDRTWSVSRQTNKGWYRDVVSALNLESRDDVDRLRSYLQRMGG